MTETRKKNTDYLKKDDLLEDILDYKKSVRKAAKEGIPKPKIPDVVALKLLAICKNMGRRPNFSMYPFLSEMIDEAIEDCIRGFERFDENRYRITLDEGSGKFKHEEVISAKKATANVIIKKHNPKTDKPLDPKSLMVRMIRGKFAAGDIIVGDSSGASWSIAKIARENAFGFFSRVVWYAFINRIKLEKKHLYTKYKIFQNSGIMDSGSNSLDDNHGADIEMYDNMDQYIKDYEAANDIVSDVKKKKRKKRKKAKSNIEDLMQ